MTNVAKLFGSVCDDYSEIVGLPCSHYITGGYCTLGNHFRCLEYILHNEPPLSYSAISEYTACHRKFYWNYLVGLESTEKSWALKLGSHASKILGWLHNNKIESLEAVRLYQDYIEEQIKATTDPEDEERLYGHVDIWKMKAIFDAYIKMDLIGMKGIPEYEFRWNEVEYPRVHGFVDLVELITYDQHFGWEFKWTGNPDNYSKFLMEDQIMAYFIGDDKINRMTTRCFVTPDSRPKRATKKQSGESMLDFYQRVYNDVLQTSFTKYFIDRTYWKTEYDLQAYKVKAKRVAMEIMRYVDDGGIDPFYQNKKNCLNPFRCDYLLVCENNIEKPWEMECFKKRGNKKGVENAENVR